MSAYDAEYQRAYREKNRERLAAHRRAYRLANLERVNAMQAASRARRIDAMKAQRRRRRAVDGDDIRARERANRAARVAEDPEGARRRARVSRQRSKYGLEPAQLDMLVLRSAGRCDVCARAFGAARLPCIDHDHATGAVRGMLCDGCNRALGMFGDDLEGVQRVVRYLAGPKLDKLVKPC